MEYAEETKRKSAKTSITINDFRGLSMLGKYLREKRNESGYFAAARRLGPD